MSRDLNLIQREVEVYLAIAEAESPIGIRRIASVCRLEPHEVRYAINRLTEMGLVASSPCGSTIEPGSKDKFLSMLDDMAWDLETMRWRLGGTSRITDPFQMRGCRVKTRKHPDT